MLAGSAWPGWRVVRAGGGWRDAVVVGISVGLVWGGGGFLLLAFARGFGVDAIVPLSVLDFSFALLGAVLGGWWAMTARRNP